MTYGTGANKNQKQNYALQVGSGTTFTSDYRTLAGAATVSNTLLQGGSIGYSSASVTASLLTNLQSGNSLSIFSLGPSVFA